jgi:hypothetical protein
VNRHSLRIRRNCFSLGLVILGASLAGCSRILETDRAFGALVDTRDINRSIVLDSAEADSSPGAGILITARITNRSGSWAVFPAEYGAMGYVWNEASGQWKEVPNLVQAPDIPYLLGPRGGEYAYAGTVVYSPGSAWPGSTPLRVLVHGRIKTDDGTLGEEVGAFIDIPRPG